MRKFFNTSIITLFGLFILLVISRIQYEFLWFDQFNLQLVLFKRYAIQFLGFIIASVIALGFYLWQKSWLISQAKLGIDKNSIRGLGYLILLLTSFASLQISLFFLLTIALLSIHDPSLLGSSWFNLVAVPKLQFLSTILLTFPITFILLLKRHAKYVQIYIAILFIFISIRSWPLWSIALTVPSSDIYDPILNSDISFSLVRYPALSIILLNMFLLHLSTLSLSAASYIVDSGRLSNWEIPTFNSDLRSKLRIMLFSLLVNISIIIWLSRYNILWSSNNFFPGAGWLDVHFNLPLRNLSLIISISSALIYLFRYNSNKFRKLELILPALIFVPILAENTLKPLLHWMIVRPRELSLEYKYIERAINSTRKAFQLDSIKTKLIEPKEQIRKSDLNLANSTLRNIRLWDPQPLLATNRQLQQLRVYYAFANASLDRYRLDPSTNEKQQVIISAREIDQEKLPDSSKSWLNKHFIFTHGYGFTVSPVNTKGSDGLPEYFISDLGKSTKLEGSESLNITKFQISQSIPIGNAAIYFGTYRTPYAIAPTKLEELDYPEGDKNIFNHYSGYGGIPLNTLYNRIIASINLIEPRLLNTGVLTSESRLLIRRNIKKRINHLAPFIDLIGDPYFISTKINNDPTGKFNKQQYQYWIVEGYTKSSTYPYSSIISDDYNTRYIRNSVKIVIDAYNGSVNFFINESNDPIINGWKRIFPTLFHDLSEMPESIKEHLKVPTDLFNFQVQHLLKYHVTDVRTFYNGDDIWQVPQELYGKRQVPVKPYHVTAQLTPNSKSEFLLLQPFSPLARPNLSGWLAARSDDNNYGELILLRFPSESNIFGPEQIQALINQDPNISQQFSLWDRAGSEVIQGNLLVLPFGRSLIYVEPVYLKSTNGGLPTLTRVVVSDGKKIAMAVDLKTAIAKLLDLN